MKSVSCAVYIYLISWCVFYSPFFIVIAQMLFTVSISSAWIRNRFKNIKFVRFLRFSGFFQALWDLLHEYVIYQSARNVHVCYLGFQNPPPYYINSSSAICHELSLPPPAQAVGEENTPRQGGHIFT